MPLLMQTRHTCFLTCALFLQAAHNLLTLFKKVLCKGTMPQDLVGLLFVELDRQRSERLRLAKSTLLERARAAVAEGARFSGGSPAGDALLRLAAERAGGGRGAPVVKGGGGGAGVAGAAGESRSQEWEGLLWVLGWCLGVLCIANRLQPHTPLSSCQLPAALHMWTVVAMNVQTSYPAPVGWGYHTGLLLLHIGCG
jgi:hypothetical protein